MNFRVDPVVAGRLLPAPFHPKLVAGWAIAGICLIRLKDIRPTRLAFVPGVGSENAAHRFAVQWEQDGQTREGVFISRRDSNSRINALLGGRLVPGEHHYAKFEVEERADQLSVSLFSDDGQTRVRAAGRAMDRWPRDSVFASLDEASRFFEGGSLGYSPTRHRTRFDGLELRCLNWSVRPMAMDVVESSLFDNHEIFPAGSAAFDCALLMRGVEHEWHSRGDLYSREPVKV